MRKIKSIIKINYIKATRKVLSWLSSISEWALKEYRVALKGIASVLYAAYCRVVVWDGDVKRCICVDARTKQAYPRCPRCIGTGRLVKPRDYVNLGNVEGYHKFESPMRHLRPQKNSDESIMDFNKESWWGHWMTPKTSTMFTPDTDTEAYNGGTSANNDPFCPGYKTAEEYHKDV